MKWRLVKQWWCVKHMGVTVELSQARLQRGSLLLKQGKLDEAERDFKTVVRNSLRTVWINLASRIYFVVKFQVDGFFFTLNSFHWSFFMLAYSFLKLPTMQFTNLLILVLVKFSTWFFFSAYSLPLVFPALSSPHLYTISTLINKIINKLHLSS